MQDAEGRLRFTPDYAEQVKNIHIDWPGVVNNLGQIATKSAMGVVGGLVPPLIPLMLGDVGWDTSTELHNIDKQQKGRRGRR